jgi:hypothetical protein
MWGIDELVVLNEKEQKRLEELSEIEDEAAFAQEIAKNKEKPIDPEL